MSVTGVSDWCQLLVSVTGVSDWYQLLVRYMSTSHHLYYYYICSLYLATTLLLLYLQGKEPNVDKDHCVPCAGGQYKGADHNECQQCGLNKVSKGAGVTKDSCDTCEAVNILTHFQSLFVTVATWHLEA